MLKDFELFRNIVYIQPKIVIGDKMDIFKLDFHILEQDNLCDQ
jgi:hypothetical protein